MNSFQALPFPVSPGCLPSVPPAARKWQGWLAGLVGWLGLLLPLPAQVASDNFDDGFRDPLLWGPRDLVTGSGVLAEQPGRVQYSVVSATLMDRSIRPWIKGLGSVSRAWSLEADVHNSLVVGQRNSYAAVGIGVKHSRRPEHLAQLEFFAYWPPALGFPVRGWTAAVGRNEELPDVVVADAFPTAVEVISVRLEYLPAGRLLKASIDPDGPGGVASWVGVATFSLGTGMGVSGDSNWELTVDDTLGAGIYGISYEGGGTVVPAGKLWIDAFRVSGEWAPFVHPPFAIQLSSLNGGLHLEWPSLPLFEYQIQRTADLKLWLPEGAARPGNGQPMSADLPIQPGRQSFRVQASLMQ
ncbi:MAG: hypothetical protein V4675_00125 [Verrucomicrobiota bacterium]